MRQHFKETSDEAENRLKKVETTLAKVKKQILKSNKDNA